MYIWLSLLADDVNDFKVGCPIMLANMLFRYLRFNAVRIYLKTMSSDDAYTSNSSRMLLIYDLNTFKMFSSMISINT